MYSWATQMCHVHSLSQHCRPTAKQHFVMAMAGSSAAVLPGPASQAAARLTCWLAGSPRGSSNTPTSLTYRTTPQHPHLQPAACTTLFNTWTFPPTPLNKLSIAHPPLNLAPPVAHIVPRLHVPTHIHQHMCAACCASPVKLL